MIDKLEPNMYVRTKKRTLQPPQIARIRNVSKDSGYKNQYYIELDKNLIPSYEYHIYEEDIENAKHSLIELVKIGDYVNGKKITRIIPPDVLGDEELTDTRIFSDNEEFFKDTIETILTKEQFEAMQYEIK